MKKNHAAIVILLLLVITAIVWIVTKSNSTGISLCILALCAFLALDSAVDYWRRRPQGKRAVYQLALTLVGCCGVIVYLVCTLCR